MEQEDDDIADAIHYPDCWDTGAYPTLAHALWEMIIFHEDTKCSTCNKPQGTIKQITLIIPKVEGKSE